LGGFACAVAILILARFFIVDINPTPNRPDPADR
jgi:hypothetical protein